MKPRIVIVGAGFGGLFATRQLSRVDADITLIDRHNYHLFQPLLYQVATAGLAPSDIAWPIRGILSGQKNVTVLLDQVCDVNLDADEVITKNRTLPYDYLILATGANHAYFGYEDWELHAPGLKSIDDATSIRHRVDITVQTHPFGANALSIASPGMSSKVISKGMKSIVFHDSITCPSLTWRIHIPLNGTAVPVAR